MSDESPYTRDEILEAFRRQEVENVEYWSAFDTAAFFRPIGRSWSPAETVRHLSKSTRPVVKALTMPRFMLRVLFRKPRHASMRFDELRARYQRLLAEGGKAGKFSPSPHTEVDFDAWRASILQSYASVNATLWNAIQRWPDPKLDSYQLPHPLLGKLTVREMLFFTLYHQHHHVTVVQRNLAAA